MAVDEALLASVAFPLLRTYSWAEDTVSAGCFVSNQDILNICTHEKKLPVVRRWTGGGVVTHRAGLDFSYSLILPKSVPLARMRAADSYLWIHRRLAAALRTVGLEVGLVSTEDSENPGSRDCFRTPVRSDLMANGRKIAGAGQRRTRKGLLHQGNVSEASLPEVFAATLARELADEVREGMLEDAVRREAERLRDEKYASGAWTLRR